MMAVHLFETGQMTLAQSAKLASMSIAELIELLGLLGVPAVDYPPEELEKELQASR